MVFNGDHVGTSDEGYVALRVGTEEGDVDVTGASRLTGEDETSVVHRNGLRDGAEEGAVGEDDGTNVGRLVGMEDGSGVGFEVGILLGEDGTIVGRFIRMVDGTDVGREEGLRVGAEEGAVGEEDKTTLGR